MILQVEVSQNTKQIINAIKLLKGVKSVSEQGLMPKKKTFKEVAESKADHKAWLKAREDLAKGDTISHEELKRKLNL